MGLEAYLFQLDLGKPVEVDFLDEIICHSGFERTNKPSTDKEEYRSYFYELDTKLGVTEAHMLVSPRKSKANSINVRFSVMSPPTVISQTFSIFRELSARIEFDLIDTEIINHLYNVLRSENKVDDQYQGLSKAAQKQIEERAKIEIDEDLFKKNELKVMKRELVMENSPEKEAIRNDETIFRIEKQGLVNKYFGWVLKTLNKK
ncbi:MAG: hypothetical protein ACFB15_00850 [Cyclobacteriaceae bacterium]